MRAHPDTARGVCAKLVQINKLSGKLCRTKTPAILPEFLAAVGLTAPQLGRNVNLNLNIVLMTSSLNTMVERLFCDMMSLFVIFKTIQFITLVN